MPDRVKLNVPYPGKSKPRPRVTMRGTFNPPDYEAWKKDVRGFVRQAAGAVQMQGALRANMVLHKDHFILELESIEDDHQYLRGDVDNIAGGIMDAIQDKKGNLGLIENDSQIRELHVRVAGRDEQ